MEEHRISDVNLSLGIYIVNACNFNPNELVSTNEYMVT